MFSKDITVINRYYDKTERKNKYKVSYVKGFWSSNNGVSINGTQLTKADGYTARILLNDSRNAKYQNPKEFLKETKTWTLQTEDYLVKGKVNFNTLTELLESNQEVMKISSVSLKDYGTEDMQHFAIIGA